MQLPLATLYIPEFVQEGSLSGKTQDEKNTELLKKIGWVLVSFMKAKLCSLTLLGSTVMITRSVIQSLSNAIR
jgi:hypothetical protein